MEGPAGTGKTRAILEKILALAVKYPNSRHLIFRKTRASMTQSVLVTFEQKVLPLNSPIKNGPTRAHRNSYDFPNGSTIVVSGLDNPGRTFSTEYDTICGFEAFEITEGEWEDLFRARRNGKMPYQQSIADVNPWGPGHWLNQRANAKKMTRLLSRHEDNPLYWDREKNDWTQAGRDYVLGTLERLSGHRKQRLRYGKWVSADGQVYEDYNPSIHLIDQRPIPRDWRRIRSIDFGFNNPFVCQWWAIDPDGRMYLYREIYFTGRTVKDHASGVFDGDGKLIHKGILQLSEGENIEADIADHDREDRATLEQNGILTRKAHKDISPGIEAVSLRLRVAGDGKPRLFVMRDAVAEVDEQLIEDKLPTCTEQEWDGYVYPKAASGKPVKELPIDKDNHGMDAVRYAVAYVDDLAGCKIEFRGEDFAVVSG